MDRRPRRPIGHGFGVSPTAPARNCRVGHPGRTQSRAGRAVCGGAARQGCRRTAPRRRRGCRASTRSYRPIGACRHRRGRGRAWRRAPSVPVTEHQCRQPGYGALGIPPSPPPRCACTPGRTLVTLSLPAICPAALARLGRRPSDQHAARPLPARRASAGLHALRPAQTARPREAFTLAIAPPLEPTPSRNPASTPALHYRLVNRARGFKVHEPHLPRLARPLQPRAA